MVEPGLLTCNGQSERTERGAGRGRPTHERLHGLPGHGSQDWLGEGGVDFKKDTTRSMKRGLVLSGSEMSAATGVKGEIR